MSSLLVKRMSPTGRMMAAAMVLVVCACLIGACPAPSVASEAVPTGDVQAEQPAVESDAGEPVADSDGAVDGGPVAPEGADADSLDGQGDLDDQGGLDGQSDSGGASNPGGAGNPGGEDGLSSSVTDATSDTSIDGDPDVSDDSTEQVSDAPGDVGTASPAGSADVPTDSLDAVDSLNTAGSSDATAATGPLDVSDPSDAADLADPADPAPVPAPTPEYGYLGFPDVASTDWFVTEGWLDYVVSQGLMTGHDSGIFEPDGEVKRGQVVTILYRLANPGSTATTDPASFSQASHFVDAAYPAYWNAAITWCEQQGIVTGYQDAIGYDTGTFGPDDPVTREELATMIARFARMVGGVDTSAYDASAFEAMPDHDQTYAYSQESLKWCASAGILAGEPDAQTGVRYLKAREHATRAETAKMITVLARDVITGIYPAPAPSYVELDTPYVDQIAEGMPMGCEAASLYMAMRGKGYLQDVSYLDFIATMPLTSGTPNDGFVGNPAWVDLSLYQSIYPMALACWGSQYGNVADISGSSVWDLVEQLQAGNPVVVYVTVDFRPVVWSDWWFGPAVDNAHVMTLVGYDPATDRLLVADPNSRGRYWVDWFTFYAAYGAQHFAAVVW